MVSGSIAQILQGLQPPVLVLSTRVGRGMYSIGEALCESLPESAGRAHYAIEDLLPPGSVKEDLERYKLISERFRPLLYLIYTVPVFYWRKYARERYLKRTDLSLLEAKIRSMRPKTVVCVSHRASFWASNLKEKTGMDFGITVVVGEYGRNLGYRYLFWERICRVISPLDREKTGIKLPEHVEFLTAELPARRAYHELSMTAGDRKKLLLVCGFWGQGPMRDILGQILASFPQVEVAAVCGENRALYDSVLAEFGSDPRVRVYGVVDSLAPLMAECASIVTKPGISTLVEARAARRKIFLLKGMPVAEDNNARYAIENFGAEWYGADALRRWVDEG